MGVLLGGMMRERVVGLSAAGCEWTFQNASTPN